MDFEGVACLEYELRRFLSRCPRLVHQLAPLLQEGHPLAEEEVADVVAELFLHPKYTIPLIGCLRCIAQKIVEKVVYKLKLVLNLRSSLDISYEGVGRDAMFREIENLGDTVGVINYYCASGRAFVLHEFACLALSRALDLVPDLLGSVRNYFDFAPPPFARSNREESISELLKSKDGAGYLLDIVRVSYRLLSTKPEEFSGCWNWSCFLDLIERSADFYAGNDDEMKKTVLDLRWCGMKILSIVLKTSERSTRNFSLSNEEAFMCSLRWQEHCQDVSLEKAGWHLESFNQNDSCQKTSIQTLKPYSQALCLSKVSEFPPLKRNKLAAPRIATLRNDSFVLTSAMKKSFEMVQLAVNQRWSVLLYGPAGSGKTKLISELASESGNQVLSLHMDDQIDGKTLIGSYVCTELPGKFRWQPGSLTQAIMNGFWVVFEDIDKAPADVQSILLPLLEGSRSFVTNHGEEISVAEGFQLFSTISRSNLDICRTMEGHSFGNLWRRVMIPQPSNEDMKSVVKAQFPELDLIADRLIETFDRVNRLGTFQFGASGSVSRFSLRDLMKWCKRISDIGSEIGEDGLSDYTCERIYLEAVDVFASFSTSVDNRLRIMNDIAIMWNRPAAESQYPVHKPVIKENQIELQIGRVTLERTQKQLPKARKPFVPLRSSMHAIEKIAGCVKFNEPILLVGETGTGKTTLVQSLAMRLGQRLTVLNLSQQSDVADLLGGFKPTDAKHVCIPLYNEFESLYTETFQNKDFLIRLQKFVNEKNWKMLLRGFQKCVGKILETLKSKGKRKLRLKAWEDFSIQLGTAISQSNDGGMIFSFVEGAFVKALRNGEWILLDEVNLAPPETLQRIIGVLEEESGSLCLAERGDINYVKRHENFRIFACMNPATDAGKRDLPYSLRSRFTEFFVDDILDDNDLILFIKQFMDDRQKDNNLGDKIVQFYKAAKKESEGNLSDGAKQKPQYSLRSLYRALEYMKEAKKKCMSFTEKEVDAWKRSLYDGFCMFFLTLLDKTSSEKMHKMIVSYLLGEKMPKHVPFNEYLTDKKGSISENYVLTRSVKEHLGNLARAIFVGKYPVLLQGPTSSGKTSLVQYLATVTGHEFVRINNHEHTDLQEYLGSYITDSSGKLVFHEGVLVKAVRNGHWIVLDELNLAPSDVLEALNRLLDDNRELFVPELNETIQAHPNFLLFATQNPPTLYGGRKMLSRAFRNRFVEIHVDEIPKEELSTILKERCEIAESYAEKMIKAMEELQVLRQKSNVFAGKDGFITPRDLFRWADRYRVLGKSYEDFAKDGYFLLAERLRDDSEKVVVKNVLQEKLKVNLDTHNLYNQDTTEERDRLLNLCKDTEVINTLGRIAWTESMWRLYFLIKRCYEMREPVLLVGETGGGKTTVCQLLSIVLGKKLHILNCHQYTETSDFLGGFYPLRERSRMESEFKDLCEQIMQSKAFIFSPDAKKISTDISQISSITSELAKIVKGYKEGLPSYTEVVEHDVEWIEQSRMELVKLHRKWKPLFTWQDGKLIEAMKNGGLFLVDEISLADDSVLERLNSVLEPERKLALAEKGGPELENITAHPDFFLLATMNPGGDYGKKELSPALRNRFTEIWVPPVNDANELKKIALHRISDTRLSCIVDPMLIFWEWFNQLQTGRSLTVRDLLSWLAFMDTTVEKLLVKESFLHGAFLVLLDGLSLGTSISKNEAGELRERCLSFLLEQLKRATSGTVNSNTSVLEDYGWAGLEICDDNISFGDQMQGNLVGLRPFCIPKGNDPCKDVQFAFKAPTTRRNALRVLRAMQLPKPVLLEGSPGVGKTSLIVNLGKISGHNVVRINLSEQTDMMDLLGSDLPVESDEKVRFSWSDGILLQAIKNGSWVLLDELNLAPQSVLEGLNAILDHRSEVFIPELGVTFKCPPTFRVFACQNPSYQGGGRKGLPKSFLNRFTKVYVDELVEDDYLFICSAKYPDISKDLLSKVILFNKRLHEETMVNRNFAQVGSPWEFNLRDVIRSCQIIQEAPEKSKAYCFLNTMYIQRMRTTIDREKVLRLFEEVFGIEPVLNPYPRVHISPKYLTIGDTCIERNLLQGKITGSEMKILPILRQNLESVAVCVEQNWLCILVGSASSGKTSLIRLLSQLTGNVLNELNLSSASDISELLGGFEQYNAFRHYQIICTKIERYMNEYCSLQLEDNSEEFISKRKDLLKKWLDFSSNMNSGPTTSISYNDDWREKAFRKEQKDLLAEIIKYLKKDIKENKLAVSWSFEELDTTVKTIEKLSTTFESGKDVVKFEWVTGMLVKAIENGEWIVLENANLCNPTILDRINSLVEPEGSITVNECGTVDGKPLILTAHPNFRIFLTIDPSYGEVSRAMRNRGVEINIMPPYQPLENRNGEFCNNDIEFKDVERFLVLSGIPLSATVDSMAKAHIYARFEGARISVKITYLELGRWVQLYKQLIARGYQSVFSLQLSWEHTYLSSLGEAEGKFIINNAIVSCLSRDELYKNQDSLGGSLSLPGGWPIPLTARNYVSFSRESTVRQNCMYLEYLGSQYACYLCSGLDRSPVEIASLDSRTMGNYPVDMQMLQVTMFPHVGHENIACYEGRKETELPFFETKLLFAANWVIEQATENDLNIYLSWFKWFASRLDTKGKRRKSRNFFSSYMQILKQELKHSVWKKIGCCREKLLSHYKLDVDSRPIPILSLEMVDLFGSNNETESSSELLNKAINCVGILRACLKQRQNEEEYRYNDEKQCFQPVLEALWRLENSAIDELVDSSDFDSLLKIISSLLEDHIACWEGITLSKFESLQISWRSLMKNALKLRNLFPNEVANLQVEGNKLNNVRLNSQKSLLWVHGGHPSMPSSADLFQKQQQLLSLCKSIWTSSAVSWKKENDFLVKAAVSSNPELRTLAAQGVCMSSYILGDDNDLESRIVQQLEELYQMLLKRIEFEKEKLRNTVPVLDLGACCTLSPTVLCTISGFDSWLHTVSIIDNTSFLLDMDLLQELSKCVTEESNQKNQIKQALSGLSGFLESTMNYMLNFSSRPPTDILAHQKILTLEEYLREKYEALSTFDAVNRKEADLSYNGGFSRIANFVLEMWFSWHSALWTTKHTASEKMLMDVSETPLPDMLFKPVLTNTVSLILQSTFAIKDYNFHCLKLRVGSNNLWKIFPKVSDVQSFLLSTARDLFRQIIFSHKKSFEADNYPAIKSSLDSLQENTMTEDSLKDVISLLSSSRHSGLASLVDLYIKPVLRDLYGCSSPNDMFTLGCAWVRVGALRYHLLIICDGLDPALKYSCKYTQLLEKIQMLELENEVRKESTYLAGGLSCGKIERQKSETLEGLKAECEKIKRKIVYRSDPGKFKKLRGECLEFLKEVTKLFFLIIDVDKIDMQQINGQVYNCQGFLDRLSSVYSAYADIIQPVQVAIYEIKLGLSLVISNAMQTKYLKTVGENDMERVLETVHSFMKFPRSYSSEAVSVKIVDCEMANFPSCVIDFPSQSRLMDMNLLKKLVTSPKDGNIDDLVSLQNSLHHNFLFRVAQSTAEAQLMDEKSFKALVEVFVEFASLWMKMKVKVKTKEENEAQQYKFRPRAFKIESIIELDISTLGDSLENETLSEWQELLSEEDASEQKEKEGDDKLEEEWNVMQDSLMNSVVQIHNQIFGSKDLIQTPGLVQLSESEELSSFIDSYTLGVRMIKGLEGLLSSDLDVKLTPEHLFRVCLEHENKFNNARTSAGAYNFYKDSNASIMAKMVERVTALQLRIVALSAEMDDHPAIMKIKNVVEMILAIPLSTPLAKALSGLQFLVNRVQVLQETVSKFPLSDVLEPIYQLISSWHKLEFESWPALLDEVQVQFENNAAKLWFPLYSILLQSHSDDKAISNKSTIGSLEEFIQSSSVGEFKRRLQLLLAYYGYIGTGISRDFTISWHEDTTKVLYNIFGFYAQYLPTILEHVEKSRNSIEKELKDLLKLCRWDRPESYVSIENSKRTRQKFQKLIQKYTDLLQQPILLTINHGARQSGTKTHSLLPEPKTISDSFDKNMELLNVAKDQAVNIAVERSTWFMEWRKNVDSALQNFHLEQTPKSKEIEDAIGQCLGSVSTCTEYQEKSKQLWFAIESISRTAKDCAEIWKDDSKSLGKRRVLTDILKLLEDCGLAKHRSIYPEDVLESGQSNCWLLLPSYEINHLLLRQSEISIEDAFSFLENFKSPDKEWRITNEYYFKSIGSCNLLKQICQNFHRDFTSDQVHKSRSFLDHLLEIQQKQRKVAYTFAKKLSQLRKCASLFEPLSDSNPNNASTTSDCSFAQNQLDTYNCMWQQKQVLGSLCSMAHEVCLLLKTVENAHLNTCQSVKASASVVRCFIEERIPKFQKSKDLLDAYLLGHDRVTSSSCVHPCIISKQMEQTVKTNSEDISNFQSELAKYQDEDIRSVKDVLLGRFEDIFKKKCALQGTGKSKNEGEIIYISEENATALGAEFGEALEGAYKHIVGAFHSIMSYDEGHALSENSVGNITESNKIFKSYVSNMRLDAISEAVVKTFNCAGKLMNHHSNGNHQYCLLVAVHLKRLHSLLNLILTFGDCLLREFLNFHGMVSVISHALSNIFASLYSKGFGIPNEEQDDENTKTQEGKGTGMGNGDGREDVSDQLEDPNQLLGTSDKPNEEKDELNDVPNKSKGIEMEDEFEADLGSVSEDSGDDKNDEDEETPELDSKMGETGDDSEAVDEKLCDKDDNDNPDNKKEKNENGPSVNNADTSGRELRAKEESDTEFNMDESEKQETDGNDNEDENDDGFEKTEEMEDMDIDEKEEYAEPTGLKIDEPSKECEDIDVDEEAENMEDDEGEELDEREENDNSEEINKECEDIDMDEHVEKKGEKCGAENIEKDEDGDDVKDSEKTETPSGFPKDDMINPPNYDVPSSQTGSQPKGDSFAADLRDFAPKSEETKWSSSNDHNDLAPTKGLPNSSDMEVMLPDSSSGGKISNEKPQNQLPQRDNASSQKIKPNPLRSIGEALEEWKERVKVSVDAEENKNNTENQGEEDMDEVEADEYGYTTELDKGTAQALGPATEDQKDKNFDGEKPDREGKTVEREEITEVGKSNEESETGNVNTVANIRKRVEDQMEIEKLNETLEESEKKVYGNGESRGEKSDSLVSVKRSFMSEDIHELGRLSLLDTEMAIANNNIIEESSSDMRENAKVIWRKYEQQTTRLSQELAEQLRLVMEPTLASKLQGDYKTGKRINMKKVIPYIASHYRKDKIWLRRTRPNKRNYQVVIAVDDSNSMSENRCGDVAIEALVTVCRAMAQLEVGDLAVASFGKGGNVRLLHDFDRPFTGESGEKMISNLTFKQENTIADSPVGDLLKYVNSMLDAAVVNARLPSGQNPLQQLVLIIADGSFHEENLKIYVRDVMSKKRMVAFILLDSQEESIMDRQKVSITGGKVDFSRYMDSFPFPYYIVLRNIEALPRTLADLLRQWFEIMQNSRE